jgi:hypothetical protein
MFLVLLIGWTKSQINSWKVKEFYFDRSEFKNNVQWLLFQMGMFSVMFSVEFSVELSDVFSRVYY